MFDLVHGGLWQPSSQCECKSDADETAVAQELTSCRDDPGFTGKARPVIGYLNEKRDGRKLGPYIVYDEVSEDQEM